MDSFKDCHDLRTAFDDFLTLVCISSSSKDRYSGFSQELLHPIIARYALGGKETEFHELAALLTAEMKARVDSGESSDILGEYYDSRFVNTSTDKSFMPWAECEDTIQDILQRVGGTGKLKKIYVPGCGSGRLLIAALKHAGWDNEFYGTEKDPTCVKMAIVNLYFNGAYYGEVMQSATAYPEKFADCYGTSALVSNGVRKIVDKKSSKLWDAVRHTFRKWPANLPPGNRKIAVAVY